MTNTVKIQVCSDTDFEQLIAEIYIDDKFVALVSQDEGVDNLRVEFPGSDQNESTITRKVDFEVLCHALSNARRELVG
ncbi:hypothetical protein FNU76_19915 [Chitinimonas arctica]|uniref:Uncharacterized protein n=1 Tax=Chitinimonas arctica TaxID=2594795 RepID=A0A516SJW6_9NEIS|nr:hypothetical protein [Chitinimonas arctica]QDQ28440.1 hypothetical protein FNU76_19915 [Chitinimonas arctica]